ncbi:hypothetical protein HDU99_010169, partial [Rhizoclosmatium hyalinum]
ERISLRSSGSESGESNGFLVDSDSDSASESAADSVDSDTAAAQSNSDAVSSEAQQKNQAEMRRRIVAIQSDPAIPPQEKAKKIQELMTSQWSNRQRRHSSRSIGASNKLDNKTEDFGIVTVADTEVSYHDKDRTVIGCKHYQRSCKLQAHCCGKWYPCRFCHDEVSDHNIIR